jgi:hypothetical protein
MLFAASTRTHPAHTAAASLPVTPDFSAVASVATAALRPALASHQSLLTREVAIETENGEVLTFKFSSFLPPSKRRREIYSLPLSTVKIIYGDSVWLAEMRRRMWSD